MGIRYPVTGEAFRSYGRVYRPGELIHIGLQAAAPLVEAGMIKVPSADDLRQQVAQLISEGSTGWAYELLSEAEHYYPAAFEAQRGAADRAVIAERRQEFRRALAGGHLRTARSHLQDLQELCAEVGESCADEVAAYAAAATPA